MEKQPILKIPKSRFEWSLDLVSVVVFIGAIAYLVMKWTTIPNLVPGHYNAAGEVDRWGGKAELLILPIIGIFIWAGMTVLEKFPHAFNYPYRLEKNIEAQYRNARLLVNVLKNEGLWLFTYLMWIDVQIAIGNAKSMSPAFLPACLIVTVLTIVIFLVRGKKL